ncbi:Transmembrane domain-containing protein [Orpheovirus IHUMI-LCC2]|uniref:Transmembrane domain-containing protein n=1 Tax=Orpheovirus IHUMI-LCC2 TaxID=2023057 RepID=A0A2I2L509_9VIRU|nr:Transmembrane domain-containing protein [Orpheovirus IHUMI-LCC2]SNW62628.1 Transmembrane domain-containing protein [Orpheovirus IHUMI-LCC2]
MSNQNIKLVNDTILIIFGKLTPSEIINYCNTNNENRNLCKIKEFYKYFVDRFFVSNLRTLKDEILEENVLNLAKAVYDTSFINVSSVIKGNQLIKKAMILYHIGNYPLLLSLEEKFIIDLFDHLYPSPTSLRNIQNKQEFMGIQAISDIFDRAFSLKYSLSDIHKLLGAFKIGEINYIIHNLYYLCYSYDRKDIYNDLKDRFTEPTQAPEYNINYIPDIAMMGSMGRELELYSNYLLYTNDDVSGMKDIFNEHLIENSKYPKLLFNKYKNNFLDKNEFNQVYNGNLNEGNYIPYLLKDEVNLKMLLENKEYIKETLGINRYTLKTLNPKLIDWLYNIDQDDGDSDELAVFMFDMITPNVAWELLSIITKGKKKENIDNFYSYLITEGAGLGYIPIVLYTALVYRLTLPSSNLKTLQEYIDYVSLNGTIS